MLVKVFKPVFKTSSKFVLYPMRVYHLRLRFRRLRMRERLMDYFAYVDCVRAGIERGDGILPVEEWDVDEKLVMRELVDEKEAEEIAFKAAVSWGNMMVISWWRPEVKGQR